jgi:TRAP-type C4-dicarboxylate transport system substrate-binding protein
MFTFLNLKTKMVGAGLAAALSVASALPAVAADNLRMASAFGPNHPSARGYEKLASELERLTEGRFKAENFASGLVAPNEMLSALESGIVDVGSVLMAYFPAEFIEAGLPGEMGLLNTSLLSASGATTEYIATCAECLAEFTALGQVYTGTSTTSGYQILSKEPINALADLQGKTLRTGSAAYSRWAEKIGAVPVQMPAPAVFEALNQGVVEAHINSAGDLNAYQLFDIITQVTEMNFGTFNGISAASMRLAVWQDLSSADRALFMEAFNSGITEVLIQYKNNVNASIEKGKASGITFVPAAADILAANEAFLQEDLALMEERLTKRGITDAGTKIKRYQDLVAKWEKLTADVMDIAEYNALITREVWSKIDLASYPN